MEYTNIQKSILIIDDDAHDRFFEKDILESKGYIVYELEDGSAVEDFLKFKVPDLVITDWIMPITGGAEVIKTIRANPAWNDTPILVVTQVTNDKILSQAFALGANDHINKNFAQLEFVSRVERVIKLSEVKKHLIQHNNQLSKLNDIISDQNGKLILTAKLNEQLAVARENDLKKELEEKKERLLKNNINFTRSIERYSNLLDELESIDKKLKQDDHLNNQDVQKNIRKLKNKIKGYKEHDDTWTEFKEIFEIDNKQYFAKLRELSPNLSIKELRICAYISMNFEYHEIANILFLDPNSFKVNRHRIKKKLGLIKKEDLRTFLIQLKTVQKS